MIKGNRDEVVIATKVHGKMHDGPNGAGLSRKAILSEIDKSLALHCFRSQGRRAIRQPSQSGELLAPLLPLEGPMSRGTPA